MSRQKFSRDLKRSICIEYMQSGKSRKEIALKYNLPSVQTLSSWINSCLSPMEIHEKCVSLQPVIVKTEDDMAKKEDTPMDVAAMSALIEAQKKQIAKLEKVVGAEMNVAELLPPEPPGPPGPPPGPPVLIVGV